MEKNLPQSNKPAAPPSVSVPQAPPQSRLPRLRRGPEWWRQAPQALAQSLPSQVPKWPQATKTNNVPGRKLSNSVKCLLFALSASIGYVLLISIWPFNELYSFGAPDFAYIGLIYLVPVLALSGLVFGLLSRKQELTLPIFIGIMLSLMVLFQSLTTIIPVGIFQLMG